MFHSPIPTTLFQKYLFVAACPAGKPFGWEVFRCPGFAGGAGSKTNKIFLPLYEIRL